MKITLLLTTMVFLFSCKGKTDYTRTIDNQSGETIRIIARFPGNSNYRLTMIKNQKVDIFTTSENKGSGEAIDPTQALESLIILNERGDTCAKDYRQTGHWVSNIKEQYQLLNEFRHKYTYTIYKTDF